MSEEEKRKMVIDTMISHGYSLEIRYDSESDLYNGTFVELTDEPKIYGKSLVEISNKFHSIIEQRFGGA